jgi:D-glycero-D-manno-heptose 1,7-bisphosphate phosphatase
MMLNRTNHESVISVFRCGVQGVFSREQTVSEFLDHAEHVRRGIIWAGRWQTRHLLGALKSILAPSVATAVGTPALTARIADIFCDADRLRDTSCSSPLNCVDRPMIGSSRTAHFPGIQFVFLDRDGVINRKAPDGAYVSRWNDFHTLPNVESAIAALNRSGKRIVVITNQRGIALGRYSRADVDSLHAGLQEHLAQYGAHIDAFYVCPHDREQCDCRKPKTGLLEQAFRDFPQITAANSILIGDSLSDIQAAHRFGIPSILIVHSPQSVSSDAKKAASSATAVVSSLFEAVETCLF